MAWADPNDLICDCSHTNNALDQSSLFRGKKLGRAIISVIHVAGIQNGSKFSAVT